ncbi:hypothetical protein BU16DRAFT_577447 [Lophium mytilinum]|uniref:DUF4185 domain-containing protein n=1 Tax=Lophium mytilinum TaxID=390894 RepID=A0A6A6R9S4_9PEZI|nr:hypothetical protein BU16DRAFT_577447 [Lophium mytilinum]
MFLFTSYTVAFTALASFVSAQTPAAPIASVVSDPTNVTSDDPPAGKQYSRDSGFPGTVGTKSFTMNYDTSLCDTDETSNCVFVATNSFVDHTANPAIVHDPPNGMNLCNTGDQLGWVTNVIGVNSTHGVGFFTNITHANGAESAHGSRPIIMDVSNDTPVCTNIDNAVEFWTLSNHAAYSNGGVINGTDGYIYLYGTNNTDIYLARVLLNVKSVSSLSAYQYWNGDAFVSDESAATPVLTNTYGGSPFFSTHYNSYVYLSEAAYFAGVLAARADQPQGPFSSFTNLFNDPDRGGVYLPYALPQYDTTGQTVAIVYSVVDNFSQRVRTITWGN